MSATDPVAVEILRNKLIATAYEMGAVLRRTAYSPNIREREDCSCVLADTQGRILAQAEHIPGHLGLLTVAMPALMERIPPERWVPGDVAIFNDPYDGGSHLPDIRIVAPIFVDGELVGFAANLAHHADVGGMAPGSMPATATEIYQEGVRIPFVKLYNAGELNRALLETILINVRTPEEREGDLKAQIASVQLGCMRVEEVVRRIGSAAWRLGCEEILNYSERLMRARIRARVPQGQYSASLLIDDDGVSPEPIRIAATVTASGDDITVDFTGTDLQREASVNCLWGFTVSATYFVVKAVVDPTIPVNSGCYRPIRVHSPFGTAVRPVPPVAVASGNETWQRIAETLIAAFATANPRLVKAPSHGCMNNTVFGGTDPRTGRLYTYYETIGGGEGAWYGSDGMDGVHVLGTNTMNTPIEVVEMNYPLRVETYELIPDSGGVGARRGGLGIRRRFRVLGHSATLVLNTDWMVHKPTGLEGGGRGRLTRVVLDEGTEQERVLDRCRFILRLPPGSSLTVESGGGNGYGRPEGRDPALVARDILDGKVTAPPVAEGD